MNKKNWLRFAASISALVAIVSFGGLSCRPPAAQLSIGAVLPMHGGAAQYGEEARRGAEIAITEINERGGIKGRTISLSLEDSETDPTTADLAFARLTASTNIQVVLTEVSGVVLRLASEANKKKVLLFNIGAQNPEIRNAGPYVFSDINDATVETKKAAEFAFTQLGFKRAAILYSEAAYGQGARTIFDTAFRAMGGSVVAAVQFTEDAQDFSAQILEIKRADPQVVYLAGLTKDMAKVLKQAFQVAYKTQWLSYAAFEGDDIIKIAGPGAEGVIYTHERPDFASPVAQTFLTAYQKKYSGTPGIYSATTYDAVLMTAAAIGSVGNDADKIRDYFLRMAPFQGAAGTTKFLANGAVERAVVFKTVRNGKFVVFQTKEAASK